VLPDGHHKSIIEHTLNVLFFPGIHRNRHCPNTSHHDFASNDSQSDSTTRSSSPFQTAAHPQPHPIEPGLPIPGTGLSFPSPFHFRLHIITRFSFNEQGRITHHRDFWDVRDVLGLVPGVSLAQWIVGRLAARGLSLATRLIFGGVSKEPWSQNGALSRITSESVGYGNGRREGDDEGLDMARRDLESARGHGHGHELNDLTPGTGYGSYGKNALAIQAFASPRKEPER
jgi:hypothetical protein